MKIWVIGRNYPMPINGMCGSFEIGQAKMLARGGHDVTYIAVAFHPFKKIRRWGLAMWEEDGITVCGYSCPYFPARFHIELQAFKRGIYKKALDKIVALQGLPDVIHVHYPAMIIGAETVFTLQSRGVSIVCTEHWTRVLLKKLKEHEKRRLQQYAETADAFLCVGAPLKESILALTGSETAIQVVPNIVEKCFVPRERGRGDDAVKFIAVGRLVACKQFDRIIEAFAGLYAARKNIRLTIVGGGEEYPNLQGLIHRLGLEGAVRLTGVQPREGVAELVAASDCLICYSNLETFGVPIIEAWACGLPVISSDCLGFAEYWREGLGYIVDHNDLNDLTEKMDAIIAGYEKFDRKMIAEFAQEQFGEAPIRERIVEIYRNCRERAFQEDEA